MAAKKKGTAGSADGDYGIVYSSGAEESEDSGPEDAGVLEVRNAGRSGKESKERKAARNEIAQRSRMWQTVGSSDEEDGGDRQQESRKSSSSSSSSSSSTAASSSSKKRHGDGGSGSDSTGGSDDDASDSDSESDDGKSRKKKHKKHKKSSKHKKSKHRKHKKDKKHKKHKKSSKHKKDKKRRRDGSSSSSDSDSGGSSDDGGGGGGKRAKLGAVNQDEYGKYGIIQVADRFAKAREFEAWCGEVKKAPGVVNGPQWEVMEYFREYMEDYNTATLPHAKYYDFERWEAQEYARRQAKEAKQSKRTRTRFDDEAALGQARSQSKQQKAAARLQETLMLMDKDKVAEMKHQKLLVAEMQHAFKAGDTAKVKELEKRLDPEIEDARWGKYNAPDLNQYNPST